MKISYAEGATPIDDISGLKILWATTQEDLNRVEADGRFSRLVADRYLKAWKYSFPNWPIDLDRDGQLRKRYIAALREPGQGYYEPLILYMMEFGGKDAPLSEILGQTFLKQNFQGDRLLFLIKAYLRRGYLVNETINNGHRPLNIALQSGLQDKADAITESR